MHPRLSRLGLNGRSERRGLRAGRSKWSNLGCVALQPRSGGRWKVAYKNNIKGSFAICYIQCSCISSMRFRNTGSVCGFLLHLHNALLGLGLLSLQRCQELGGILRYMLQFPCVNHNHSESKFLHGFSLIPIKFGEHRPSKQPVGHHQQALSLPMPGRPVHHSPRFGTTRPGWAAFHGISRTTWCLTGLVATHPTKSLDHIGKK